MPWTQETLVEREGEQVFESVLVHAGTERQRGLLMFPNALSPTQASLETARELAARGYAVLLADLYGVNVRPATLAGGSAEARKLREDPARWRVRLGARLSTLRSHGAIDGARVGAFGFCFGGACALELARSCAAWSRYTARWAPAPPAQADTLKASVFVMHGAEDPFVPESDVRALERELREAKADWQLIAFGGAYYSFADKGANMPGKAMYDAKVVRRAFRMLDDFFGEVCA